MNLLVLLSVGHVGWTLAHRGLIGKLISSKEILEVKGQMCELTQEVTKELKLVSPAAQPNYAQLNHARLQPQKTPRWRRGHSSPNRWDTEGRPICRQCQQSGRIARYCKKNVLPQEDLN